MKALIVEDEPTTRLLLTRILSKRGHEVIACSDAEEAWEAFSRAPVPLLVLDWLLPGIDGLELCRRIRALPDGDRSVILVATARDRTKDLQTVLDAGANDYLTKPLDIRLLNVRLTIAEQRVKSIQRRKDAEARVAEMVKEVEGSRDDMLSILNRQRVGTAMTDETGAITFLSDACQSFLDTTAKTAKGIPWEKVFPFAADVIEQLKRMAERPPVERGKISASLQLGSGRSVWVDVELQNDPRDPRRWIFFLYDMSEVHGLRKLLGQQRQLEDLIGKSEPMLQVYGLIREVARVETTVLVEGETGTGKELVARAIHSLSERKAKPFIPVNCAGLTESLLASQLFGHKRGSFTGAVDDHSGFFESANGGTIFLDEIGDIPTTVQTNLLRVLQEKEITRVGESKPRKIDVRVIAATSRDLPEEVEAGRFRADLLYRVRVARVKLPPLRERRDDIPLLTAAFLQELSADMGKEVREVSPDAMRLLLEHHWPGNVRELRSAIAFGLIRCHGSVMQADELPPELGAVVDPARRMTTPTTERARVLAALRQANGNRTHAAKLLGMSRATFYRRLVDLGIDQAGLSRRPDPSS